MSLENKTVVITGSTGGIGKQLVKHLVSAEARLILVDRNRQKAECLKNQFPNGDITLITADMEDITSVNDAAEQIKLLHPDSLILNAGAYSIPRRITDIGFDNVFEINFVSPYFLVRELLPVLKKVVAVSSIAHNYSKIDENNIDFRNKTAASKVYGNAKRWLTLSLFGLFQNEKNASLAVTHPGITFTGITNHYPKLIFAIIKHPMKIIFMKPKTAALSVLEGLECETKEGEWIGPKFFNIWGKPKKQRLQTYSRKELDFCTKTAEQIYRSIKKVLKST